MKIFDITKPLSEHTVPWEGEQSPLIQKIATIENGDGYNVTQITTNVHIATHIDAPRHFLADGHTIDQIPLEKLVGKVAVVEVPPTTQIIDQNCIETLWQTHPYLNQHQKILFKTANSLPTFDQTTFNKSYTALNTSGAKALLQKNIHFVGIDYHSISIYTDISEPHRVLLEQKVVILEGAQLAHITPGEYSLYCLPLNIVASDGAPVRAILTLPQ